MIKDEKADSVMRNFETLSPDRKEEIKKRAAEMRRLASEWEPFICPHFETWRSNSKEICGDIADCSSVPWTDRDGVSAALEVEVLDALRLPSFMAWEYAYRHLDAALQDERVKANPVAVLMLENALNTADESNHLTTPDDLYHWIVYEAQKKKASQIATHAASQKNAVPREWVLYEWEKRSDKGQSKASFARQYASLVKNKFSITVLPETGV